MRELMPFLALFKRHWGWMAIGLSLSLLTLVMAIGLLSLSGWFISAAAFAGLTVATAQAFNYMVPAGGVRGLSIGRTAARYGERLATHNATFKLLTELRLWLWKKLVPMSEQQLSGYKQSDLLNRLVADIDTLDHIYLRLITPMLTSLVTILLLFGFLSLFDTTAALALSGLLLALWLLLPPLFYQLGKKAGRQQVQAKRELRATSVALVSHAAEARVFGYQDDLQQAFFVADEKLRRSQKSLNRTSGLSVAGVVLMQAVAIVLVAYLAGPMVEQGAYSGAVMALLLFATLASFEAIAPVAAAFQYLSASQLAANRVNEVVANPTTQTFGEQSIDAQASLQFSQVSFAYPGQSKSVLQKLSFTLEPGKKLGLFGPSGVGKSTVLALVNRQWHAAGGTITLGGQALEAIEESKLRQHLVTVSQRVHVFNGTLRENLAIAGDFDETQLVDVLNKVGLGELVDDAQGLEQWLGEGGRSLSGGEKRRLQIARALLREAPLWLLDEPTEGLDAKTEAQILELLTNLPQNPATLWVTHNPDHKRFFDGIIELS
ncbi:heme ABC transporter ATP-binding protein/permease CydC [Paraferrimonas sedimenticola]|uniref:Cysteine/glutathione ABC transporter ATP-binding protein/permease CydC n=1 Tax=Paraferrimonas sedimenticola TaxID=375674 RepID=A0AA37RV80_9GAMM|nr:cysteine/glutathione ABC transporter ATP-binding protein/permease CydC [Paraferrimonas sedimenticola]GLP96081.1 cysteine/glutathione ABC transporter ATP-binding protein/permease CydC [Paraferrimonas sedimenticola]